MLHVQSSVDSIKCFFVQIISTLKAPPKKRKSHEIQKVLLHWQRRECYRPKNCQIIAKQNYCCFGCSRRKTHSLSLPSTTKKWHNKNAKRHRTASQSQSMVQASQLEILPCIYSRLFHIQFERQHIKISLASKINGFSFSSYTSCTNNTSSGIQPPPPFNMFCHQVILVSYWIAVEIRETETLLSL